MKRSLLLLVLVSGCVTKGRVVDTTVAPGKVGSPFARLSGYFAACGVGCQEESVPADIRHDVILDEAVLFAVGPETCADVVVRTFSGADEPLAQLAPAWHIDGAISRAVVFEEKVTVVDHSFTGMAPVVQASGVTSDQFLSLGIERPTEKVFRVVERRARVCAAVPSRASAALELRNKHLDVGASQAKLTLQWRLEGAAPAR